MKLSLQLILCAAAGATSTHAQIVDFSGQVQASDLTMIPWVQGSTMWGAVDSSTSHATSASALVSLVTLPDITLFSWTFGNLELSAAQSPGIGTPGYEIYTDSDLSGTNLTFSYDGEVWATGEILSMQVDVTSSQATSATGTGMAQLTSDAGSGSIFFSEIMGLTNNTGMLAFTVDTFNPVDANGLFATTGSFAPVTSAVPEPETYALFLGLGGMGLAMWRRRRNRSTE